VDEWTDHADRQRIAQAEYEHVMASPAPTSTSAYVDAGVIGFVFGEMWRRGVLTGRDRRWITLACVGLADAAVPMETHTYAALRRGEVTVDEIDEFLLFFATQAGWPKGSALFLHILGAMAKVAEEDGQAMTSPEFVPWADPVADDERRARGVAAFEAVHGSAPPPPTTAFAGRADLDYLYGEIWTRDEHLTRRDRRLIAIVCAAAVGIDAETTAQLEAALRSGDLAFAELQEAVVHIAVYLGWIVARHLDHLLVEAAATTGSDR
jgi:4-carboxymuconolactone decarboxylase